MTLKNTLRCSAMILLAFSSLVFANSPRILYLYGDVADDGTIPSGEQAPFHQMRLNDTGPRGMSQFSTAVTELGFELHEAYDAETELTPAWLASVRVLILGSNQKRFSEEEAAAVRQFVERGGGLVAWSDSAFGGHWQQVGVDKGRVVGIFDRNLFWNAGEGTQLSHADNREFTQRVMIWAAHLENNPEFTSRIGKATQTNP